MITPTTRTTLSVPWSGLGFVADKKSRGFKKIEPWGVLFGVLGGAGVLAQGRGEVSGMSYLEAFWGFLGGKGVIAQGRGGDVLLQCIKKPLIHIYCFCCF